MSVAFGRLVDTAAKRDGWNDYQLQGAIGLYGDRQQFHATQVARLRAGKSRHVPPEVVARLIDILKLDPAEAWHAAGQFPPDATADDIRRILERDPSAPKPPPEGSGGSGTGTRRSSPSADGATLEKAIKQTSWTRLRHHGMGAA